MKGWLERKVIARRNENETYKNVKVGKGMETWRNTEFRKYYKTGKLDMTSKRKRLVQAGITVKQGKELRVNKNEQIWTRIECKSLADELETARPAAD